MPVLIAAASLYTATSARGRSLVRDRLAALRARRQAPSADRNEEKELTSAGR